MKFSNLQKAKKTNSMGDTVKEISFRTYFFCYVRMIHLILWSVEGNIYLESNVDEKYGTISKYIGQNKRKYEPMLIFYGNYDSPILFIVLVRKKS